MSESVLRADGGGGSMHGPPLVVPTPHGFRCRSGRPGERGKVAVVAAALVVPYQTEGAQVTVRPSRQGRARVPRMGRIVNGQRRAILQRVGKTFDGIVDCIGDGD